MAEDPTPSPSNSGQRPIPVVAAVITDDRGRFLLAQRPAHKKLGLKWEFPGGKVEPGETPEAALARELREELGIEITGLEPLPRFRHDYGFAVIDMIPLLCRLAPTSPAPYAHEHVGLVWAELAELTNYDLAPADLPVVEELRKESRKRC
jgi:8-oxo-dGTP diphosphatase